MAEYRLSPAAQADLNDIYDFSVSQWGNAQAARYADLIDSACAALAEAPHLAQNCDPIRQGYRRRGVGRHMIYFRITPYGIAVIRILHQHMDAARYP